STGRGPEEYKDRHGFGATLTGCLLRQAPEAAVEQHGKTTVDVYRKTLQDEQFMDGQKMLEDGDRAAVVQSAIDLLKKVEAAAIRGTYYEGRSFAAIGR